MKLRLHTYLISLMAGLSSVMIACSDKHSEEPEDKEAPRTVLVYMVAKSNLSSYSKNDLAEMRNAALSGHLRDSRLLVYCSDRDSLPRLWEIKADAPGELCRVKLREYNDEDMSVSRRRMEQVIEDVKFIAPARKYGLIMWGHGTGYVQDGLDESPQVVPQSVSSMNEPLISTQSYGGESSGGRSYWMNTTTLAKALDKKGFDWVYFDCCFMAGVEVAYELRNVTDYIVASATELPAEGMPYHRTLKYLMPENSDLTGAAQETFNYYNEQEGMYRTCTMSVIDVALMDNLAASSRSIFTSGNELPEDYRPQDFQTASDQRRNGWAYYDFAHYMRALAGEEGRLRRNFDSAFSSAVIYETETPFLWNSVSLANHNGLSTLIIESEDDPELDKKGYRELSWWTDVVSSRFK